MPETKVPEDQFEFLRNKLTGNEAFARLRGRWKLGGELGALGDVLEKASSPTEFCKLWNRFSSDTRFIGNLLAQLRRDGMEEAERCLTIALKDETYRLPGEITPLHETNQYTILMFDLPRTLVMFRWIRHAHITCLDSYLDQHERLSTHWNSNNDRELTHRLFKAYPGLLKYSIARHGHNDHEGIDLISAYREHVLNLLDHIPTLHMHSRLLRLAHGSLQPQVQISNCTFGFLIKEDQGSVLAEFSREQQETISSWSIRLPKAYADSGRDNYLFFGFHPEQDHRKWKKASNAHLSPGCSNGYGVVAMDNRHSNPHDDHSLLCEENIDVENPHLDISNTKPAFELTIR